MVFPSSIPLYLDSPNWNQHPNQQLQATNSHHEHEHQHHHQLIPQPQQPAAHQLGIGGPGPGPGPSPGLQHGRPNSMTEQARQMKLPPPLAQQKCPRCASTNTKFCYYNNYNLSQPRHFCKACRRYWTHGGALRNVPIGGGCRKNKRSSSKSTPSSSSGTPKPSIMGRMDRLGSHPGNPSGGGGNSSLPFMSSTLQNLIHSGAVSHNMGLTYSGGPMHSSANPSGIGGLEFPHMNQRHLQFPNFLGGFEIPGSSTGGGLFSSSYQNVEDNNNNNEGDNDQEQQMNDDISKNLGTRMISSPQVKMEDNNGQRRLNLANQMLIMGISPTSNTNDDNKNNINNNNQYNWGSNVTNNNNNSDVVSSMWMSDLSGLNSSSNTSHLI